MGMEGDEGKKLGRRWFFWSVQNLEISPKGLPWEGV